MAGKVNYSVVSQSQINAWKKELEDSSTTQERKREIINNWTATRVADAVNRGTQGLEGAADRSGWNTERADIVSQSRTTFEAMHDIGEAMCRLEGGNRKDVREIVGQGSKIFFENAKTAYKDTLYLHESFDEKNFLKETTEGVGEEILTVAGEAMLGTAVVGGGYYAPAMLAAPSYAANLFGATLGVGAAVTTGLCVYKAGDYIYMKATLPEMQKFPEAQDL